MTVCFLIFLACIGLLAGLWASYGDDFNLFPQIFGAVLFLFMWMAPITQNSKEVPISVDISDTGVTVKTLNEPIITETYTDIKAVAFFKDKKTYTLSELTTLFNTKSYQLKPLN